MPALLTVSFFAAVGMTACVVGLIRPSLSVEIVGRAVLGTIAAAAIATTAGVLADADTPQFLLAASFATAPVIVLLGAAAEETAPGRRGVARLLVGLWSLIVFPVVLVAAPLLSRLCGAPACRVEDFGAGLALFVSAAAAVLLAGRSAGASPAIPGARFLGLVAGLWASTAVWLASLEGAVDDYTPRILLATLLAPLGGAIGWLLVDIARGGRHPLRAIADGLVAGLVAIVPGAATIAAPWSLVVGAIAGGAAAFVYGARRFTRTSRAGHWALVVLTATAIGFLAPAIAGDTIGLLVSGRMTALLPPLIEFVGATAIGVLLSAPAWARARRADSMGKEKPPV